MMSSGLGVLPAKTWVAHNHLIRTLRCGNRPDFSCLRVLIYVPDGLCRTGLRTQALAFPGCWSAV